MLQYLLLLLIPSSLLYIYDYYFNKINGPLPLPIIGNIHLLTINTNIIFEKLTHYFSIYGNVYRMYIPFFNKFGINRWIFVNDPESIKYIMKDNFDNYPKGEESTNIFKDFLGNGIFNSDGENWKFHRKTASHMFKINQLKYEMTDIFVKHADRIVKNLSELSNIDIDIQQVFYNYTLSTIYEIGIGIPLSLTPNNLKFSQAFDDVQHSIDTRFYNLFWKLLKYFNIGRENKINTSLKIINNNISYIIKNYKKLSINDQSILYHYIKTNPQMTCDEIRDVILNFMLAGRDTTAVLLSWSIYIIMKYPEYQTKILDEFNKVNSFDYQSISKLRYLQAFLYEVLRLYPSVPLNSKIAVNNDTLPNKAKIYSGDRIVFSPWTIGRNPNVWKKPEHFIPERWLDNDTKISQYEFMAFNSGYRTCLGKNMAILEASIMLIKLLQKFKFESVKNIFTIEYNPKLILSIKDGLQVKISLNNKID